MFWDRLRYVFKYVFSEYSANHNFTFCFACVAAIASCGNYVKKYKVLKTVLISV